MRWPPEQSVILGTLLALATLLLVLQSVRVWARGRVERRRAARARRMGRRGEAEARRILMRCRYRIEQEQPSRPLAFRVDGDAREARLRPDFLVRRGGRRYVADAKAGADASDLGKRATRRQMLEYALAFPEADGVLLVDTDSGAIRAVEFPGLRRALPVRAFASGFAIGAALAIAATLLPL